MRVRWRAHSELLWSSGKVMAWSGAAVGANAVSGVLSARALTVVDKGLLAMVLTIGGLLWVMSSLGTNVALRVGYPRDGTILTLRDYLAVSAMLLVLQAGCTLALVAAVRHWLPEIPTDPLFMVLVLALSITTFVSNQVLDALHAINRSAEATRTDATGAALTAICVAVTAAGPSATAPLPGLVACYLLGYVGRLAWGMRRLVVLDPRHTHPGSRAGRFALLRSGVPFLGFNVGQVVAFRADRYLLGILSTPTAAGLYSVAATPAELLRLPVTAMAQLLMQRTAASGTSRVALRHACLLTLGITLPPALVLYLVAEPLVTWVFGPRYAAAGGVLRVMVLSEIVVALFLVISRIAAGSGLARSTGVATIAGAVVGVAALCLLAPTHGALGAAWASVCGYAVMAAAALPALLRRAGETSSRAAETDEVAVPSSFTAS